MNTSRRVFVASMLFAGAGLLFTAGSLFFSGGEPVRAATPASSLPIQGYAWTDLMGWIHFSGIAQNGSPYGVSIDTTSGVLSGYAWSPYFGGITFNQSDLTGCPSGSCTAQVSNGQLTGWARSCAAFSNKSACSGALDPHSGGWDGWIHLSGTAQNGSSYGVTYANNCFAGYAWGSRDVGAISFSGTPTGGGSYTVGNPWCGVGCYGQGCTSSGPTGSCNYPALNYDSATGSLSPDTAQPLYCCSTTGNVCPPPAATVTLTASPSTINIGQSSDLSWKATNATFCTSKGFNTGNATSGSATVSPITTSSYTITCTGTGGPGSDSTTVVVNQPTVSISANPDRVNAGDSSTITWSSSLTKNCTVTGPLGVISTQTNGSVTQTILSQSVYSIQCEALNSGAFKYSATTTVNVLPKFNEF